MFDWPLRRGPQVTLVVTGLVAGRFVRYNDSVRLAAGARVRDGLQAAGRKAGADLLQALEEGHQPVIMLNGQRLELPAGLEAPLADGAELAWLLPMAGG